MGAEVTRGEPRRCDVAVIGGGPAGSAVSRFIHRFTQPAFRDLWSAYRRRRQRLGISAIGT